MIQSENAPIIETLLSDLDDAAEVRRVIATDALPDSHRFRWPYYMPDDVRESWPLLSLDARLIAYLWAQESLEQDHFSADRFM